MSAKTNASAADHLVDDRYYQVARPNSLAERLVVAARDNIYADFLKLIRPTQASTVLDVGVSDAVGEAANVLERKYPHLHRVTAVGLGTAQEFRQAFPNVAYRQIAAGDPLPFPDTAFDIATSNAVLEHAGSEAAQEAFVQELARVSRMTFISVPHRFFLMEHHTGIPLLHWTDHSFAAACKVLGKQDWADPANVLLMTQARLRHLGALLGNARPVEIGRTGIRLGLLSSNLYMLIGAASQTRH